MLAYNQVVELTKTGMSVGDIAKKLGYSRVAVYKILGDYPHGVPQETIDAEKKRLLEVIDKDYSLKMENYSELVDKYSEARRESILTNNRHTELIVNDVYAYNHLGLAKFFAILILVASVVGLFAVAYLVTCNCSTPALAVHVVVATVSVFAATIVNSAVHSARSLLKNHYPTTES
jgi:uncharacterized tellurite resistance protein B-like protein